MLRTTLGVVRFVKELRLTPQDLLDCYNLFPYLTDHGWILTWILLKGFLNPMAMRLFWWWLTSLQILCNFSLHHPFTTAKVAAVFM